MFFCDKGMAIPQIKFGFFLAFKQSVWPFSGLFLALFGFLSKFSFGNPAENAHLSLYRCRSVLAAFMFCILI